MYIYIIGPLLPILVILLQSFTPLSFHTLRTVVLPTILPFLFAKTTSSVAIHSFFPTLFLASLTRCFLTAIVWHLYYVVIWTGADSRSRHSWYDVAGVVAFEAAVECSVSRVDDSGGFWESLLRSALGRLMRASIWLVGAKPREKLGAGWEVEGVGEAEMDWKQGLVTLAVLVWIVRLVTYLAARNFAHMATSRTRDPRLPSIPGRPKTIFLRTLCQVGCILACAMPTIALNSLPADAFPRISTRWDYAYVLRMFWFWLGMWFYLRGLYFETLADWQMMKWRYDKRRGRHRELFCSHGLWAGCRHPNYYGECLVWLGLSMACSAVLISEVSREVLNMSWFTVVVICATPPVFVYYMLRYLSIPPVEAKYDRVYMHRKDYRRWRRTNTLRLWLDQDWEEPVAQDPEGFDYQASAKKWLHERGIDLNATIGAQELKRHLKQFLLEHLEEIIASNPDAAAGEVDVEEAKKWLDEHFEEILVGHPDDEEETEVKNEDGSAGNEKLVKVESGVSSGDKKPVKVGLGEKKAGSVLCCEVCS
ncbi:hypothetical protein VTJ49DRAFT_7640 [Mycothermus thermophilus]|uniref:Steroid 5-alpha reductase C-terminal domain-containing protein n=1 Tax=Humicola insolens TaxID=85995 RepID=A0ABR3VGW4_HUMIN